MTEIIWSLLCGRRIVSLDIGKDEKKVTTKIKTTLQGVHYE